VTKKLDIWPALPIVVHHRPYRKGKLDNLIAAIKHNDRVCNIDFRTFFDISQLEESRVGDAGAIPGVNRSEACLERSF
jgi:hypothetical protein